MSRPPAWKWKPWICWHRNKYLGWQIFFYQHTDHNPTIVLMRWNKKWIFEFYCEAVRY